MHVRVLIPAVQYVVVSSTTTATLK